MHNLRFVLIEWGTRAGGKSELNAALPRELAALWLAGVLTWRASRHRNRNLNQMQIFGKFGALRRRSFEEVLRRENYTSALVRSGARPVGEGGGGGRKDGDRTRGIGVAKEG